MAYTVNSYDICCPGFERLRSNSEFLIPVRIWNGVKAEDVALCMCEEIDSYEQPDGFDYDACRAAIRKFCCDELKGKENKLWGDINYDSDDDEGVKLFVFMTGPGYAPPETE